MKLWNALLVANEAADFALALCLLLAVPLVLALVTARSKPPTTSAPRRSPRCGAPSPA